MKLIEAMIAMKGGKNIRRKTWAKGHYWRFQNHPSKDKNKVAIDNRDDTYYEEIQK